MHNYWDFPNLFTYESYFFVHVDLAALEFFRAKKKKKETYILVLKVFTFCDIMIEQEID